MKEIFSLLLVICLPFFIFSPVFASSEFDSFIKSLNVEAQADLGAFKVRLSVQFGAPIPKVEAIMASVESPGDAHMCFRVGQAASKPVEVVMKEYQLHKGQGWGVIAKNLGIKPGSKEFHELKKRNSGVDNSESSKGKRKK